MIPYGRQSISDEDVQAVVDVLRSDFLTQGPIGPAFETAVASYCGAEFGIAVNSATSALHLACMALGLGDGDRLWTSPISFVASSNCGLYCGADVDFVDIDAQSYNMSTSALAAKLAQAEKDDALPKVVVPVHLCGQPCDMEGIHALSKKYGFHIIEDASHAVGARYKGEPVGNCKFSDIAVFSFHPVKIVTAGEGGMAVTNNPELAASMARLRSHGITRSAAEMDTLSHGPWFYQQIALGYNYRMTEIQAALGLSQLKRLDEFVAKRHALVDRYNALFEGTNIQIPVQSDDSYSSFHLYVMRLKNITASSTHRETFERLRNNGIGVNLHYIPIYRHPYYAKMGFDASDFPQAEAYYAEAISLPLYPDLTDDQQDQVVRVLASASGHQTLF